MFYVVSYGYNFKSGENGESGEIFLSVGTQAGKSRLRFNQIVDG